ncbi:unnamed protein product [Peronospora farinosa]|uniref:Casparian strip membrane protein domain-containing protein n=2 Tax=Peronospora farinosa TaxID=134698 RepID=A0AAV0TU09_9STRA|nr:unnamed protein product [Peronospora farinosa]CAI5725773.1 unnamed protein product [Peronospora farinosa]
MTNNLRYGQQHDRFLSLSLRFFQCATSIVALILMTISFKAQKMTFLTENGNVQEMTVYYGGPAVNFVMIVSFTACFYDVFLLLLVFTLQCVRIPPCWSFGIDAVFTMLFMSAGCALAACDYVRYCDALQDIVHCALLTSGAALCFMAFVGFLMSVTWGAWMRNTWGSTSQKKESLDQMGTLPPSVLPSDLVLSGGMDFDLEHGTTTYNTYVQDGYRES